MAKVNNVCLECGKIFTSNYAQAYCKDCKSKMNKPKGKEPKHTIADVVKMATANGISYGEQVARIEGRI